MCLNHPEIIPCPPICEKNFFHKTGPWYQKGWGLLPYRINDKWQQYCSILKIIYTCPLSLMMYRLT